MRDHPERGEEAERRECPVEGVGGRAGLVYSALKKSLNQFSKEGMGPNDG